MSTITMVERYPQNKRSSIAIRPYFDPKVYNMGLENYQLSLYDGAFHEEELACLEINGIKRFVTGLNEFAPEVKNLPPDEQESKVREIRKIVAELEKTLAANVVDPEDKEFWNKVKLLRPDNDEFWSKIKLRCSNEPVFLEPATDPYDLIRLLAIEAGGFSMVAKSYMEARTMAIPPKFYLDKAEETASARTELSKIKFAAAEELNKMYKKNANKLFYVLKVVDINSAQYKKSTPLDILFENAANFIEGLAVEKDKRKCAQQFLDAASLDMETLKLRAMIKDATYYKIIATKSDGFIYHLSSATMMGRNPSDCVEFLKNPLNEQILDAVTKATEKYWNM